MSTGITPFEFIKAASQTKEDLIHNNENFTPEEAEKQYNAFIVNRGFSYFADTVLHANEMNRLPDLDGAMQFSYYMGALRRGKRFSKWHKAEKNEDLDLIQELLVCNRTVAKGYLKILSPEQLSQMRDSRATGGSDIVKKSKK